MKILDYTERFHFKESVSRPFQVVDGKCSLRTSLIMSLLYLQFFFSHAGMEVCALFTIFNFCLCILKKWKKQTKQNQKTKKNKTKKQPAASQKTILT